MILAWACPFKTNCTGFHTWIFLLDAFWTLDWPHNITFIVNKNWNNENQIYFGDPWGEGPR